MTLQALQTLPIEKRKEFLDLILSELNDNEIASTDETELKFIQVFRKHLQGIYDLDSIPDHWVTLMSLLYNGPQYPYFASFLSQLDLYMSRGS
jgi:hypothetical protein